MPVATWLLSQQNENGGFASTSDTYVAVDALERFSRKLRIPNRGTDISVQYSYLKGTSIDDVTHKWGKGGCPTDRLLELEQGGRGPKM